MILLMCVPVHYAGALARGAVRAAVVRGAGTRPHTLHPVQGKGVLQNNYVARAPPSSETGGLLVQLWNSGIMIDTRPTRFCAFCHSRVPKIGDT